VISTVDREARHTRKSKSQRWDGFRGHVAAELETGLVTDCEMTMAAGPGSTDAENGVKMTARDRFTGTPGGTGPGEETGAAVSTADCAGPGAGGPQDARLEVYGDSAYGSGEARAAYRDAGHDIVIKPGPLRPAVPGGFTIGDFTIDEQAGTVTGPAGHPRPMSARTRTVNFGDLCAGCPLHHRQGRPVNADPPARGPAARRPRPGPHRRFQEGLPHPVSHRADHFLDRHPERPPGPAPLPDRHWQHHRLPDQSCSVAS
jgi:hypothetical protein